MEILEILELHSRNPKSLSLEELEVIIKYHNDTMLQVYSDYIDLVWEQAKANTEQRKRELIKQQLKSIEEVWKETEPLLKKYKAVYEAKKESK